MAWLGANNRSLSYNNRQYSTGFPVTETPLSEGGLWASPGASTFTRTPRVTGNTCCFGDPASSGFDDSIMVLTGSNWGPKQVITGKAFVNGAVGAAELELHARITYDSTNVFTYECDLIPSGVQFAKWMGGIQGNIIELTVTGGTYSGGLNNGDIFEYTCLTLGNGNVSLVLKQNGSQIASAVDDGTGTGLQQANIAPYLTGSPGIGFDVGAGNSANASHLGWASYSVVTSPS